MKTLKLLNFMKMIKLAQLAQVVHENHVTVKHDFKIMKATYMMVTMKKTETF